MLPFGASNIQEFIERWNRQIPIDKWYRKKYKIPFNSPTHRAVCLADMFAEFWEFINEKIKKSNNKINEKEEFYKRGQGNFMKEPKIDIDKLFDELDIDNMD